MNNFNKTAKAFAIKVAPIYRLLEWEWSNHNGGYYVPNALDIYKFIVELNADIRDDNNFVSCGGIQLRKVDDDGEKSTEIEFVLSRTAYEQEEGIECTICHQLFTPDSGEDICQECFNELSEL